MLSLLFCQISFLPTVWRYNWRLFKEVKACGNRAFHRLLLGTSHCLRFRFIKPWIWHQEQLIWPLFSRIKLYRPCGLESKAIFSVKFLKHRYRVFPFLWFYRWRFHEGMNIFTWGKVFWGPSGLFFLGD